MVAKSTYFIISWFCSSYYSYAISFNCAISICAIVKTQLMSLFHVCIVYGILNTSFSSHILVLFIHLYHYHHYYWCLPLFFFVYIFFPHCWTKTYLPKPYYIHILWASILYKMKKNNIIIIKLLQLKYSKMWGIETGWLVRYLVSADGSVSSLQIWLLHYIKCTWLFSTTALLVFSCCWLLLCLD